MDEQLTSVAAVFTAFASSSSATYERGDLTPSAAATAAPVPKNTVSPAEAPTTTSVESLPTDELTVEQSLEQTLLRAASAQTISSSSVTTSETVTKAVETMQLYDKSRPAIVDCDKYNGVFDFDLLHEPSSFVTVLLELLQLDDNGIEDYLLDGNAVRTDVAHADASEANAWLKECAGEDRAGRRYAILKKSIARHVLYSYCDVLYVLNPHVQPWVDACLVELAANITVNYAVDVELAYPNEPTTTTNVDKNPTLVSAKTVDEKPAAVITPKIVDDKLAAVPAQVHSLGDVDLQSGVTSELGEFFHTSIEKREPASVTSVAAAPPIPPSKLHRGDPLSVVLQRMRELNPNGFERRHPRKPALRVSAESCMLLDLLAMNEVDRNFYILQCAFERNLLCVDEAKQQLELNPDLYKSLWDDVNMFACEEHVQQILSVLSNARSGADGAKKSKPTVVPTPATVPVFAKPSAPAATPLSKAAAKKLLANAAAPALSKKPLPNNTQAAQKTAPLSKNAMKKLLREGLVVTESKSAGKTGIANNKPVGATGGGSTHSSIDRDLQNATKCMQSLMVEYKQTRPDCDAASNHSTKSGPHPQHPNQQQQHKRGARGGNSAAAVDQSAEEYRKTILFALQRIYQQVQSSNAELGQLSEPHEYEEFVRTFDRTVIAIQNRLHADPIAASTVAKPQPGKPQPSKKAQSATATKQPNHQVNNTPLTFNELVNKLTLTVTNNHKHRCTPFYEPTAKTTADGIDQFDDPRNQVLVDKFVDKLLAAKLGKLVEGDIRINAYNLTQAYITSPETTEDTLVEGVLLRQCAMHSDLVRVFVFDHTERTKDRANRLGFVVRVLEKRNDRIVLGHATPNKNRNYFMLLSTNKRVPALRIAKTPTSDAEISDQMLYMARLTGWLPDGQPLGEIVRTIGDRSVLATNNEAILLYNKLEVPSFSKTIVDSLPSDTFEIPHDERQRRTDLTGDCIFTIDPATARDLDDALSVRQLPNGNHEVGVHISDVSYFIAENTELDHQIRQQTTSIYLVDNVYHMLPRSLCMTCSLLPGQDKLAFSVFWEMTDSGDVVATRFARTVIRSCVQLSYEHAQRMLDEPDRQWLAEELPQIHGDFTAARLADCVGRLHRLARPLRERRFQRNCLKIDQPKITFRLNEESGEPMSYERYNQIDSNWLIEEFMLLANQTVAQTIFNAYPECALLRNHSPPKQQGVEMLAAKLEQFNYRIDTSTPEAISVSLYKLLNNNKINASRMAVLCEWLTRPMNRALYICSAPHTNNTHFALSIPIYTHFTSPIRRYPDVLVHRLLAAALNLAEAPKLQPSELEKIAERCNEQKYNAKCAGEASTELYFAHYVRRCKTVVMRAVVTEMVSVDVFELMLLDTGAKLKVFVGKHKPAVHFRLAVLKPMAGTLHFKDTKTPTSVHVAVFAELMVSVTVNDTNSLKVSILPMI